MIYGIYSLRFYSSGGLSDIRFWHSISGIISHVDSNILSGLLSSIYLDMFSRILSSFFLAFYLTFILTFSMQWALPTGIWSSSWGPVVPTELLDFVVEARSLQLRSSAQRSGARTWGPAVPLEIWSSLLGATKGAIIFINLETITWQVGNKHCIFLVFRCVDLELFMKTAGNILKTMAPYLIRFWLWL